jgi:hypothetical protein
MKSSTFLRIAAVITFLYFAGHTAGIPWTPAVGPAEVPVLDAMKAHSFDVLGSKRTYWDLYFGSGLIISLYLLVQAVVLWQLGSLAKREPAEFAQWSLHSLSHSSSMLFWHGNTSLLFP